MSEARTRSEVEDGVRAEFAMQEALSRCERITRTEARNFYYGLRLLPLKKRTVLFVVYAWMRVLDDIGDSPSLAADSREHALAQFEVGTRAAFGSEWHRQLLLDLNATDGTLTRTQQVLVALANVAVAYELNLDDFLEAIEGQRMDLAARTYTTFSEVERYCDCVASSVGRICVDVWGLAGESSAHDREQDREQDRAPERTHARHLATLRGIAFQQTNILRDIAEDLAAGRVYLPADELARYDLTPAHLVAWSKPQACAEFMRVQCQRAQQYFRESAPLDALVARDARASLQTMSAIYREILARIAADPQRALRRRVRLGTFTKCSIALRARFGLIGSGA